jgi:hypothetical protein
VALADGPGHVLGLRPHPGPRAQLPARRTRRPPHHPGRLAGPFPGAAAPGPRGARAVHRLPPGDGRSEAARRRPVARRAGRPAGRRSRTRRRPAARTERPGGRAASGVSRRPRAASRPAVRAG